MNTYRNNIWETLTEEQWKEIIKNSSSKAEVARKVGRCGGTDFNKRLDKYIKEHCISIEHFTGRYGEHGEKYQIQDIFIENSPVARKVIKEYIAKYNLLEYKCSICGNRGEWLGTSLTLQLDHINGINNDNRLENLRWLCPNCHTQTPTYNGKNKTEKKVTNFTTQEAIEALLQSNNVHQATKLLGCANGGATWSRLNQIKKDNNIVQIDDIKRQEKKEFDENHISQSCASTHLKQTYYCKKCGRPLSTKADYCQTCIHEFQRKCKWPSREELKLLIRTTPFLQIGQKYNVSDNAVRKWCINYGLPSKKKDIKNITDEEWEKI